MSLLTKRIFTGIHLKKLINHESNIIRTQYYTCLSNPYYVQTQNERKFGQVSISHMKAVREFNLDFRTANNILSKSMDRIFGKDKFKQKRLGYLWYKTLDEVNVEEFIALLEMPDTFYSWVKITQLHVWMLVFRLQEGKRYTRDGVMEAMWLDIENRALKTHHLNKKYKKNIAQFYEIFRHSLFWYDHGFLESDIVLTDIVWSVFFECECDDPEKLEAVVRYIRFQMKHLELINIKETGDFNISGVWTPLKPHCRRFIEQ